MRKKRSYCHPRKLRALSLPLDESLSAEDVDSTELASSSVFKSRSERPREAAEKDALSLSTAFATFKVILGFITMGIFLACPFFFSSSCPTTTHSVKSTVLGGTVGGRIRSGPQVGQSGYLSLAVSGIPAASERGANSEVAHKWARWLPHPCRIGDPRRFRAGSKIRSGPQVGKLATSPLPYRGSPPLQSGGQNQKWPTSGQIGYLTPAVSGIPAAGERGAGQKWPTSGQTGYLTPATSGIPAASKRGAKSEMSKKRAEMQRHPCIVGGP